MALRRELRYLYSAVFKYTEQADIRKLINFYDEYSAFRKRILEDASAPSTIKTQLVPIKPPQYITWIKQFIKDSK